MNSGITDPEISIVLPTINEADNLAVLLPQVKTILERLGCAYEILVVDGGSSDDTKAVALSNDATFLAQRSTGYGGALREGFARARGRYILTLDADLSHNPDFIPSMWRERQNAAIVIASRYVLGGSAMMPPTRWILSRILNLWFRRALSLPFSDLSSGFRLYRADVLRGVELSSNDFDFLQEALIKVFAQGWPVREVPFRYSPRRSGNSKARLLRFARSYASTFMRMWKLRNSIHSADYDERAARTWLLPQRLWQQSRYSIITRLAQGAGAILDVGCGSSGIFRDLNNCLGLDVKMGKLRYMRGYNKPVVAGSIFCLPFKDESFDCVISSEVIEHIPEGMDPFHEMRRVLRRGGRLILGTPDYGTLSWRTIERIYAVVVPDGYASEHITHYTKSSLTELLLGLGFQLESVSYVFGSEMIFSLRKV
ncbi:MAG: hypothetical protein HW403_923 [Dehalococcoidia bacterium]|nr:hypothetical protein [Dehalococcoidia bacterium]